MLNFLQLRCRLWGEVKLERFTLFKKKYILQLCPVVMSIHSVKGLSLHAVQLNTISLLGQAYLLLAPYCHNRTPITHNPLNALLSKCSDVSKWHSVCFTCKWPLDQFWYDCLLSRSLLGWVFETNFNAPLTESHIHMWQILFVQTAQPKWYHSESNQKNDHRSNI